MNFIYFAVLLLGVMVNSATFQESSCNLGEVAEITEKQLEQANTNAGYNPSIIYDNGGFETYSGDLSGEYYVVSGNDIPGWTIEGSAVRVSSGSSAWGSPVAPEGSWFISLHGASGGSITQEFSGLRAGDEYQLTWQDRYRDGFQMRRLTVEAEDSLVSSRPVENKWNERSELFKATGETMSIKFSTNGGSADGSVFLDMISLTPTGAPEKPELCDEACLYQINDGETWTPATGNALTLKPKEKVYFGYLSCSENGTNIQSELKFVDESVKLIMCKRTYFEFDQCFSRDNEDDCYEVGAGKGIVLHDKPGVWVFSFEGYEETVDIESIHFECTDECGWPHHMLCDLFANMTLVYALAAASCVVFCCCCCICAKYGFCSCCAGCCNWLDCLCCECECPLLDACCCILECFGLGFGGDEEGGKGVLELVA